VLALGTSTCPKNARDLTIPSQVGFILEKKDVSTQKLMKWYIM
jgi:hypothetical protein